MMRNALPLLLSGCLLQNFDWVGVHFVVVHKHIRLPVVVKDGSRLFALVRNDTGLWYRGQGHVTCAQFNNVSV